MAGHVINPATKFEDPPNILSWVTSYNVSHWLPLKTRTAAILFYANYKVKTQNSAWEPGSSHSACLNYVKKTGSSLLPQNAPWWLLEAFFSEIRLDYTDLCRSPGGVTHFCVIKLIKIREIDVFSTKRCRNVPKLCRLVYTARKCYRMYIINKKSHMIMILILKF